jgi:tRNA G26 N,N-dimethylase Trm1
MMGQFDLFIPWELRYEWNQGVLSAEQVLFLAEIESFVQHGEYNKRGIWCSNQKLAKKQKCSIRRIQQILQELKDKGFLVISVHKGQRYIRTCWSHAIHQKFNLRRKKIRNKSKQT